MTAQAGRRLLALVLLLAAMLMVWLVAIEPIATVIRESEQELAEAEERLIRFRRIAAEKPLLEQEVEKLRRQGATGRLALGGTNPQLAAAEMQDRVKRLVETNGATLKSTQVLAGREERGFRRVALRITMEGDIEAAQKIFHALETMTPLMFLDNLEIRSRGIQVTTAGRRSAELTMAYDVYGFQRLASP
jgi:general secretion pathway protein M